eukprot:TRINITY_DN59200_c0_g2_i2.p3 TRINITY_DN59200_c0_g2~~TRINITY_DN59200_c0_g2_i2.p3  ORF type:complete len:132 (-),score=15.22 TRINITY_DN59200_c0_g2_i2:106-501(-)
MPLSQRGQINKYSQKSTAGNHQKQRVTIYIKYNCSEDWIQYNHYYQRKTNEKSCLLEREAKAILQVPTCCGIEGVHRHIEKPQQKSHQPKQFRELKHISQRSVSYTHLTLPTILLVQISVVAVSLKKKKQK